MSRGVAASPAPGRRARRPRSARHAAVFRTVDEPVWASRTRAHEPIPRTTWFIPKDDGTGTARWIAWLDIGALHPDRRTF